MPINPDNRSDKIIKTEDESGFTEVYESSRFSEAYKEWQEKNKRKIKGLQ